MTVVTMDVSAGSAECSEEVVVTAFPSSCRDPRVGRTLGVCLRGGR